MKFIDTEAITTPPPGTAARKAPLLFSVGNDKTSYTGNQQSAVISVGEKKALSETAG